MHNAVYELRIMPIRRSSANRVSRKFFVSHYEGSHSPCPYLCVATQAQLSSPEDPAEEGCDGVPTERAVVHQKQRKQKAGKYRSSASQESSNLRKTDVVGYSNFLVCGLIAGRGSTCTLHVPGFIASLPLPCSYIEPY